MVDLMVAGVVLKGELPGLFTQLHEARQLTKTEYKVIAQLWKHSVKAFRSHHQLTLLGTLPELSKALGVPLSSLKIALRSLSENGAIQVVDSGVRLTPGLIDERLNAMVNLTGAPAQVVETIYPMDWSLEALIKLGQRVDGYIKRHHIKAGNLVYKTIRQRGAITRSAITGIKEYAMRQPIILNKRLPIQLGMREPIHGEREPIYGTRVAIFDRKAIAVKGAKKRVGINIHAPKYDWLTDSQKAELLAVAHLGPDVIKNKLNRFKHINSTLFTDEEQDCMDNFVPYYENLICHATGRIAYELIPGPYKKATQKWKQVWKVYQLCKERGWDYKVYLDAQFESFANWSVSKQYKWPLPNTLYSDRAIAAFEAYIYRNETAYQREGHNIKATARNIGTFQEELDKSIQKAMGIITKDLKHWSRHPLRIFTTIPSTLVPGYEKAKAVMDNWMDNLPVEYLAAIPDILDYIGDKDAYLPSIRAKIDEVEALQNNMAKMRLIIPAVKRAEQAAGVPKMADLMEVSQFLNS